MKKILFCIASIIAVMMVSSVVFAEPLATLETDEGDVSIVGYTTTQNEGKDVFVALLEYTNKTEESKSPEFEYFVNAFQDGIELERSYVYEYSFEDYKENDTKVRPGSTLKYFVLFELTGSGPVDVEVSPTFSFDDSHAEYTFDLGQEIVPDEEKKTEENSATDWEAKYKKLKKKYDKLKKKYDKLKDESES